MKRIARAMAIVGAAAIALSASAADLDWSKVDQAIGKPGAINAALFAVAIIAGAHPEYRTALQRYRKEQADAVASQSDPRGE